MFHEVNPYVSIALYVWCSSGRCSGMARVN